MHIIGDLHQPQIQQDQQLFDHVKYLRIQELTTRGMTSIK
jgi:hypothetical protein